MHALAALLPISDTSVGTGRMLLCFLERLQKREALFQIPPIAGNLSVTGRLFGRKRSETTFSDFLKAGRSDPLMDEVLVELSKRR